MEDALEKRLRACELVNRSHLRYDIFHRSTSLFVFFYALFYYYRRSNMEGSLQAVQFFGYTILTCYIFFLTLGTVSFFASLRFVRYIYCNIKMD